MPLKLGRTSENAGVTGVMQSQLTFQMSNLGKVTEVK